jgi:hypothetical protein
VRLDFIFEQGDVLPEEAHRAARLAAGDLRHRHRGVVAHGLEPAQLIVLEQRVGEGDQARLVEREIVGPSSTTE